MKSKWGWETEKEKLRRYMEIPFIKKLEWLRQMNEFAAKHLPAKTKRIRLKLRKKP